MTSFDGFLAPLVERCDTSHCWVRRPGSAPGHVDAAFTQKQLDAHLSGGYAYGLCPMKRGSSTTQVAVLDLDSHKGEIKWEDMLAAAEEIKSALELFGLVVTTFRSSGGMGVHLFIVWDQPQDAYSVREVLGAALSSVGYSPGIGGVAKKEVEVFPKQSSIPSDGWGSMFVLPLTGHSLHLSGEWVISDDIPTQQKPERTHHHDADNTDLPILQSALAAIPNTGEQELDYDAWFKIVAALHDATAGSDTGLELAHSFSARASKHDGDFLDHRVWPYITSRHGGVTARTIFATARKYGWQENVEDRFEVLPDEPGQGLATSPSQEGHAAGVHRFPAIHAEEFVNRAPPSWLIHDVLPRANLAVMYGESGSGKSFLALDLAAGLVRGVPWREHDTTKSKVVYIAAEGAHGMRNRLDAYAQHKNIQITELHDLRIIADAPNFMLVDDVKDVIRSIGKADLVVVDTWSNVLPGANENSGEDMGKALSHCNQIRKWTGALVLLIHHSGKDAAKGARGWSGTRAACDCEIEITRIGNQRSATVTKMKDGEDGAEYGFKLGVIGVGVDAKDRPITSCFIEHTEAPARQLGQKRMGPMPQRVLKAAGDMCDPTSGVCSLELLVDAVKVGLACVDGKRDNRVKDIMRAINDSLVPGGFLKVDGDEITVL